MKILLLPITFIVMVMLGLILIVAASISTLLSLIASLAAYIIVHLLAWQESEFLVKCATLLGTQQNTEETK